MKEKIYPINICLIPDDESYEKCCEINDLDSWDYNHNSHRYIPHVTLMTKYVTDDDLLELINELSNIKYKPVITENMGYLNHICKKNWLWSWIKVDKNPDFKELQTTVCDITKNIKSKPREDADYLVEDFDPDTMYIKPSNEKDALEKKNIHITLGRSELSKVYQDFILPDNITFDTLAIWHMWGYGSVRKILFSQDLY